MLAEVQMSLRPYVVEKQIAFMDDVFQDLYSCRVSPVLCCGEIAICIELKFDHIDAVK